MADKQNGSSTLADVLHFPQAFLLKGRISHRQHLIYNKYLCFQVRSYSKSQAHIHPAGIAFHRSIDEFLHSGKINYLVESRANLGLGHPQNRAVEKNVFASRQFPVKARAHLQEADNAASNPHLAFGRCGHTGEDLQERALTRTVPADDP